MRHILDDGYDIRSGRESNFVGREREFVFALKVIRRQGRHQWAQATKLCAFASRPLLNFVFLKNISLSEYSNIQITSRMQMSGIQLKI
jgi:hypothetical protein